MKNVAIYIFDDVEVLDFAGPFEVFSVCGRRTGDNIPFNVYTVAEKPIVCARNNFIVTPNFLLANCPKPDIFLIPGGGGYHADGTAFGSRKEMNNAVLLDWIKEHNKTAELVLSVCTGSFILAKAGLLHGLSATTHHAAIRQMQEIAPDTTILPSERWVDNGRIILSAGVSAGIDMSLYVISKILGKDVADETARYMQYDHWK
ncbi:MAG: DJ-1/PfpI family protein [Bacteroidia bacterium]|nr:DJ-1/PfpI family protein [Bacteroidia bacterium]